MGSKGFSLIEVMVTLAIVSVFLGQVMSSGVSSAQAQASIESEKLRQTLLSARNLARSQLKCVAVIAQPQSLQITPYDTCTPVLANPGATQTVQFQSVITLGSFDIGSTLVFNPQGGTTQAGPATLIANTSYGRTYNFVITPAIGTISMR